MKKRMLPVLLLLLLLPTVARGEGVATSAKACIIIDAQSGRTLLAHNAEAPLPMASTTKVMTALLALERISPDDLVTCGRNAFGVPGTSIYLSEGEALTMEQMLYGLLMASGNDAATAIAEHIGGTVEEFCRLMTERAAALGCENTVFLTPHGLPKEGHYTTARDLALIAREAMQHDLFRQIVSTRRAKIPWEGRDYDRVLNNKNRLLTDYEGATGIKTGYTRAAGRCLVFGASREGMEVIGVVLNCADWFDEAARLMDVAFARFESVTLMEAGDSLRTLPVVDAVEGEVQAVLTAPLTGVVPKGALPQVSITLPEKVTAPIAKDTVLGEAALTWQGDVLCRVPLAASRDVAKDDFRTRIGRILQFWSGFATE